MFGIVAWGFKGEKTNSHGGGIAVFGKQIFFGSCRDHGTHSGLYLQAQLRFLYHI